MSKSTAREYLVGLGLAKAGRGKFSNIGKQALAEAIEAGTEFSDYTIEGKVKEPTYDVPPPTWSDNAVAKFVETGKKTSMKNVDNGCGHSLYWCDCPSPRVFGKAVIISQN